MSRWPVVDYPDGSGTSTGTLVTGIPDDWEYVDISIVWMGRGTTKDVAVGWQADAVQVAEYGTLNQPPSGAVIAERVNGQNVFTRSWLTRVKRDNSNSVMVNILRSGNTHPYTETAALLEVTLRKAKPFVTAVADLSWYWLTGGRMTWWTDGRLYVGGVDSAGNIVACKWDPTTRTVLERVTIGTTSVDDHNNPALLMAAGKPTSAIWNNHGADNILHVERSTANESITAWDAGVSQWRQSPGTTRSHSWPTRPTSP